MHSHVEIFFLEFCGRSVKNLGNFIYPPQKQSQFFKMFEESLQLIQLLAVGNVAARPMKTNEREVSEEYQSFLRRVAGRF